MTPRPPQGGAVTPRPPAGGETRGENLLSRLFSDYGIVLALILLCVYFSAATVSQETLSGAEGGRILGASVLSRFTDRRVLVVASESPADGVFADAVINELKIRQLGYHEVRGQPADARKKLEELARSGISPIDAIVCAPGASQWTVFENVASRFPAIGEPEIVRPKVGRRSSFLTTQNLLNIANQIAVIAIIAIGMTMVIITGGIDLSVGSLIALSAVAATLLIRDYGGAESASVAAMIGCSLAGILLCGVIGFFSGVMVAVIRIPAFIATLGMMLVASGLAFIFARGQSIYQVPDSYVWLGRGADLGIPNAVLLMLLLYVGAHVFLMRAAAGRHVYAVGANQEAARLSGVPVKRTLVFVYSLSGLLAGLGGIVMASQLKSGAPTYGQMYELYVIAAVVVGGTSLAGGQGKAFGTLIGALIIAVIQNGMNLTGVESYTQKVVLGLVILGAVTLDMLKRRSGWLRIAGRSARSYRGRE